MNNSYKIYIRQKCQQILNKFESAYHTITQNWLKQIIVGGFNI